MYIYMYVYTYVYIYIYIYIYTCIYKGTDVAAAIEWNVGNPSKHLLLATSFNISGDHITI
jgi:hypothetical protein